MERLLREVDDYEPESERGNGVTRQEAFAEPDSARSSAEIEIDVFQVITEEMSLCKSLFYESYALIRLFSNKIIQISCV